MPDLSPVINNGSFSLKTALVDSTDTSPWQSGGGSNAQRADSSGTTAQSAGSDGIDLCPPMGSGAAAMELVLHRPFHSSLPAAAYTYAIPSYSRNKGFRHFGFHGINHQQVPETVAAQWLKQGKDPHNCG